MKQIVKQRFHGTENDRDLIEAEIQIDELEELPEPDEFEGKRLIMGSQCWVIGTGDLYGLTSTGDWVKVNFMGNGEGGGGVTDEIEEGNMNPITSNAVYNKHRIKFVKLKKKDLSDVGITTTWGDGGTQAQHEAYRSGNIVVMNVIMRVTGTFTGTYSGTYQLWDLPYELCRSGEGFITPDKVPIISGTIDGNQRDTLMVFYGSKGFFQPNKVYNLMVQGQIILIVTDYNYSSS